MDFLSFISSACRPVMGCSDLTPQNAADCGGISSSLCLSIAESSANDLLMFAARWIGGVSNKGMCCSFQVYDLQILFDSPSSRLPAPICVAVRSKSVACEFLLTCCAFAQHTKSSGDSFQKEESARGLWSCTETNSVTAAFLTLCVSPFRWGCCCGWLCSCPPSPRLSDRSPCSRL